MTYLNVPTIPHGAPSAPTTSLSPPAPGTSRDGRPLGPVGEVSVSDQLLAWLEKAREADRAEAARLGLTVDQYTAARKTEAKAKRAKKTAPVANANPVVATTGSSPGEPTVVLGTRFSDYVSEIVDKSTLPVVSTGLPTLDERLGGGLELHSTTFIVAGTGKGKTSLALQIAAHHAQSAPVVYYAGEMGLYRIAARVIGQRTGRAWRDVLRARITPAEMHVALAPLQLYGVPRQHDPITAINATLSALWTAGGVTGVPMIVVDYVQLLADTAKDQRLAMIQAIRRLQTYVETAPVVCLALSQSSRGGSEKMREGAKHAEEMVGVGAESSEIERSASNILALSYVGKDGVYEHDVTVDIAKARDGGTSKLGLKYNGRTGAWTETATVKLPKREQDRRDAILHQIDLHATRKCIGGMHSCAGELTGNVLCKSGGTHHVGSRDVVLESLRAMLQAGQIVLVGNEYRRPGSGPSVHLDEHRDNRIG